MAFKNRSGTSFVVLQPTHLTHVNPLQWVQLLAGSLLDAAIVSRDPWLHPLTSAAAQHQYNQLSMLQTANITKWDCLIFLF